MRRHNRALLVTALLVTPFLAGCADGDGQVSSDTSATSTADGRATTAAPDTTAPPTSPPDTVVAPTTAPAPPEPPTGDPDITCAAAGSATGDVDGDGTEDRVAVGTADDGTSTLEVCPSVVEGGFALAPGPQGVLALADVDRDGADEILFGGTTAMARTVRVARWTDAGVVVVTTGDGAPLELTDGYPEGVPPDGPRLAYGCDEADGAAALITLELTATPAADADTEPVIQGTWTAWRLDAGVATPIDRSTIDSVGGDDLLASLDALAGQWAPPC